VLDLIDASAREANERRTEEAESFVYAAEAELVQTREQALEHATEAAAARADVASLSAVRASLEEELAAREAPMNAAHEVAPGGYC
jgi:hypothetical protein